MTDFADLSRERRDDYLAGAGDEYRARALERADRLREVSDLPEMGLPYISVERVRPAVRSHEVKRFRKTTPVEWFFLITGVLLLLAWVALLLAVFIAATA